MSRPDRRRAAPAGGGGVTKIRRADEAKCLLPQKTVTRVRSNIAKPQSTTHTTSQLPSNPASSIPSSTNPSSTNPSSNNPTSTNPASSNPFDAPSARVTRRTSSQEPRKPSMLPAPGARSAFEPRLAHSHETETSAKQYSTRSRSSQEAKSNAPTVSSVSLFRVIFLNMFFDNVHEYNLILISNAENYLLFWSSILKY